MQVRRLSAADSDSFRFALRVRHPSIDPDELTQAFMIEPEHCFRAGSQRRSRTGLTDPPVHADSYWLGVLDTRSSDATLSVPEDYTARIFQRQLLADRNSLTWALSLRCIRFFKTHGELLRRIRSEGGEVALLVTVSGRDVGSFSLLPQASQFFGDLGILIEFELASD